jgi:hypothetical protein
MTPAKKASTMSELRCYIATQVSDPLIQACPMANQVENHFRTPYDQINGPWWNMLNMWKTSPLVERILSQV